MEKLSGKDLKMWMNNDHNLQALYDQLLPSIVSHVKRNSGTKQEANDVFQESLVALLRKCHDPDFILTVSVETYVFSIAKRMWLAELRKRKNRQTPLMDVELEDGNEIDKMIIKHETQELYLRYFKKLSESCQKVLKLYFLGEKMKEIANQLGFASEGYARKRKHQCQESLVKSIKSDSLFKELNNG